MDPAKLVTAADRPSLVTSVVQMVESHRRLFRSASLSQSELRPVVTSDVELELTPASAFWLDLLDLPVAPVAAAGHRKAILWRHSDRADRGRSGRSEVTQRI